jgi:hypothetical protein
MGAPKSNNGKALSSMIVGIVSVLLCFYWFIALPGGIVAVILGVLSRKEIAQGNGTNGGMAMTGIITGALAVVLGLIGAILVFAGGGIADAFLGEFCDENPTNPACADV